MDRCYTHPYTHYTVLCLCCFLTESNTLIYTHLFFNHKAAEIKQTFFLITGSFTSHLNPRIRRQSHSVSSGHPVSLLPHVTNSILDTQALHGCNYYGDSVKRAAKIFLCEIAKCLSSPLTELLTQFTQVSSEPQWSFLSVLPDACYTKVWSSFVHDREAKHTG